MRIDELDTMDLHDLRATLKRSVRLIDTYLADRDDDDSDDDPREHEHGNPVGLGDEIAVTPFMENIEILTGVHE
jgi:hypothetical protein